MAYTVKPLQPVFDARDLTPAIRSKIKEARAAYDLAASKGGKNADKRGTRAARAIWPSFQSPVQARRMQNERERAGITGPHPYDIYL